MTTYNETKFSVSRITTDLHLFFELTQNIYTQDPDFAERWNDYLVDMVSDRLWKYSEAVMTNELGNEIYEGTLDFRGDGDSGDHTLREAFVLFAKTSDKDHPQIWKDGEWVDEEDEPEDEEDEPEDEEDEPEDEEDESDGECLIECLFCKLIFEVGERGGEMCKDCEVITEAILSGAI